MTQADVVRRLRAFKRRHMGRSEFSPCTGNQGVYLPQCVDGVELWAVSLGARCISTGGNNARGLLDHADDRQWRRVAYRRGMIPPVGAILVFGHRRTGHTSIADEGSTRTRIRSFDQNWSRKNTFAAEIHDTSELLGWLEPRLASLAPRPSVSLLASDGHHHGAWLNSPAGLARAHAAEDKLLLDPKITWVRLDRV